MENRLGLMIMLSVVTGAAVLVAFILGYVAHNDLGMSRLEIRHLAFTAAALIGSCVATDLFRRIWQKPK